MNKQKRVAAIHDISCAGKCSLTVALPIISAAGIEVSVIPTALLSTHTGGFEGYTYRDLTSDLTAVANHWKSLDLKLDALYTGFLGCEKQIGIVSDIIDMFKTDENVVIIDPVMADEGKLYKVYGESFPKAMKKLVKKADIIIPNITEAALLTDTIYRKGPYDKNYIEGMLKELASTEAKYIILTGVYFDDKQLGAAAYDCAADKTQYIMADMVSGYYHGTGDVFASSFIAAYLKGKDLTRSTEIAVNFTVQSIKRTLKAGTDTKYGVNFEEGLYDLIKDIKK